MALGVSGARRRARGGNRIDASAPEAASPGTVRELRSPTDGLSVSMNRTILSGFGGLTAAFGSMICCTGPLVFASLGLSGAALSAWRPWRPLFVVVSLGLLILAFQLIGNAEAADCDVGNGNDECAPCADPARIRRTRLWLYALAALSFLLLISPRWAPLIF